jgi:hypothetical protein
LDIAHVIPSCLDAGKPGVFLDPPMIALSFLRTASAPRTKYKIQALFLISAFYAPEESCARRGASRPRLIPGAKIGSMRSKGRLKMRLKTRREGKHASLRQSFEK